MNRFPYRERREIRNDPKAQPSRTLNPKPDQVGGEVLRVAVDVEPVSFVVVLSVRAEARVARMLDLRSRALRV